MNLQDFQRAVEALANQARSPEDLLTQDEAAMELGVKPNTLANWRCTKRTEIPFIRLGKRSIRYRWGDVQAYLEKCRVA